MDVCQLCSNFAVTIQFRGPLLSGENMFALPKRNIIKKQTFENVAYLTSGRGGQTGGHWSKQLFKNPTSFQRPNFSGTQTLS